MAEKVAKLIKNYDGTGDIVEWLKKLKLIIKLQKVGKLEDIIPLFLEGSAFQIYDQLPENQKSDASCIERALRDAYALDVFEAFDMLCKRRWSDEPIDSYLADIIRLANLAEIDSDVVIERVFVVGLPPDVATQIRAMIRMDTSSLSDIVERARILISEKMKERETVCYGKAGLIRRLGGATGKTCYICKSPHHLANQCNHSNQERNRRDLSKITCFQCGEKGHYASFHKQENQGQGNDSGNSYAPANSQ